jgi:hypothetical protein
MDMKRPNGTYEGVSRDVQLILRIDIDGPTRLEIVSGELNQAIDLSEFNYFEARRCSFISDRVEITRGEDRLRARAQIRCFRLPELAGSIEIDLQPNSQTALVSLTGYGYHSHPFNFALEKISDYFRTIHLEIDRQDNIDIQLVYKPEEDTPQFLPEGMPEGPITIQSVYQNAGIEVITHPEWESRITRPADQADEPWTKAELNAAVENWFDLRQDEPSWNVYLLLLNRYEDEGMSGLMFDDVGAMQRQGAAVFLDPFKNLEEGTRRRNVLRTAVHELGHALNLVHSFQHGVLSEFGQGDNPFMMPRPNSLSIMNYAWRYPHGHNRPEDWDGSAEYWARFCFNFDDIELAHLRHHDRLETMFGGEAFGYGHGERKVEDLDKVLEANRESQLDLTLRGKQVEGANLYTYELLEPIHLELRVQCKGEGNPFEQGEGTKVRLSEGIRLDSRLLAVYVRKPSGRTVRFRPLVTACSDTEWHEVVGPGVPFYRDLHLTYGKDGFYFDEPGNYVVWAVYFGGSRLTAYSEPLKVRVNAPSSKQEERFAADYFDHRKGRLLATGPSGADRFRAEIDFFKTMEAGLPGTAASRTIAGYLGAAIGLPFKDLQYPDPRKPSLKVKKANIEDAMDFFERALVLGDDRSKIPEGEKPTNLVRYQTGKARALVYAKGGDLESAEKSISELRKAVNDILKQKPLLQQRIDEKLEQFFIDITKDLVPQKGKKPTKPSGGATARKRPVRETTR